MENHYLPLLRVTKGSTDGTVQEGDVVYYGDDGSLNLVGSASKYNTKWGGWLDETDLTPETTDFEYEVDDKYSILVTGRNELMVDRELKEDGKKTHEIRA